MTAVNGDHGRAEDLVQETLIRAWQHPEALADGPALPWLFTVARRLAIDAYRYRRSRPEVSQETLEREPVAGDSIGRILDAQVIAVAVARLSAPHREVIIALYYHDRSVTETADALGIPPGTVKSRSYYALKALRVALEEAVGCAGTGLTQPLLRRPLGRGRMSRAAGAAACPR